MKRTILTPAEYGWLAATFDRNKALYGGLQMADEPKPDPAKAEDPDPKPDPKVDPDPDEKLGEPGKKALDAERDARKAAEDQAKQLKSEFDGFKAALLEGLGIKPDDGDKGEDALKTVQSQLAAMQHESAVLKLANEHKITDGKDLELLATAKDAESMKKLAERLAPAEPDRDAKSRTPKPDRTQGGGTSGGTDTSGVSHGRELFKASRGKAS